MRAPKRKRSIFNMWDAVKKNKGRGQTIRRGRWRTCSCSGNTDENYPGDDDGMFLRQFKVLGVVVSSNNVPFSLPLSIAAGISRNSDSFATLLPNVGVRAELTPKKAQGSLFSDAPLAWRRRKLNYAPFSEVGRAYS